MEKNIKISTVLLVCCFISACGGGDSSNSPPVTPSQTVKDIGTLQVVPQFANKYLGTLRTENSDITIYNNLIDFDVRLHSTDMLVRVRTDENGVSITDSEGDLRITDTHLTYVDYITNDVVIIETDQFSELAELKTLLPQYDAEIANSSMAINSFSNVSSPIISNPIRFRLSELDVYSQQYAPYTNYVPYLELKLGDSLRTVVKIQKIGDGRYQTTKSIDGAYLVANTDIDENFKRDFIEKVSSSCHQSPSDFHRAIGVVLYETIGRAPFAKKLLLDSKNPVIAKVEKQIKKKLQVIADAELESIPVEGVKEFLIHKALCSKKGDSILTEMSQIALVDLADQYEIEATVKGLPFYTIIGKTFVHNTGGGNVEHEVKLIDSQEAVIKAGILSVKSEAIKLESKQYKMEEKGQYYVEASIENLKEIRASLAAWEVLAQKDIEQTIELRMAINGTDGFTDSKTVKLSDIDDGVETFKFMSGLKGTKDTMDISLVVPSDVEIIDGVYLSELMPVKSLPKYGVSVTAEPDNTELSCPEFSNLNTENMSWLEANQYCTSNGKMLPSKSFLDERFIFTDSFSQICNAPKKHYWMRDGDGTTAWAMNGVTYGGSTVWLVDRKFAAVCVGNGEFKRTAIAQD